MPVEGTQIIYDTSTVFFPTLTAQPLGYEESDTPKGLTAKKWSVQGLLRPSESVALLNLYDSWRDDKIAEYGLPVDGSFPYGATITFSAKGVGGTIVEDLECWFQGAPVLEQAGAYVRTSFVIIDAQQANQIELLLSEETPDLGTINLGGAIIKLLKPPNTFAVGPQPELTVGGVHYITGPLTAVRLLDIEGTTSSSGWSDLRSWYEETVSLKPETEDLFPISPPVASDPTSVIINGISDLQYTVSLQLIEII